MVKELEETKKLLSQVEIGKREKPRDWEFPSLSMLSAPIKKEIKIQMIGFLKRDSVIQKASIKRYLFTKENQFSLPSEQIFRISKKIAQILERKVLVEEEGGLSRFLRKILRF